MPSCTTGTSAWGNMRTRTDQVPWSSPHRSSSSTGSGRAGPAFYAWMDVADRAPDARQFALELLRHQRVAVAPGTAFGPAGEGWVRLSLAADTDALLGGARRLAGFALS